MTTTTKKRTRLIAAFAAAALAASLALVLAGCASNAAPASSASSSASSAAAEAQTRTFTDSAGRTVELPATIERIAPSGHTANQVLLTMAPEKMVGLSQDLTEDQAKYFDIDAANLPVFGAAFGAKGDINKEAVAAADPQVIIDTGEYKDGLKEDLDTLQEQLGIPCVFIETKLEDYGAAYEDLGELLGMEERGRELSDYCKAAYDETTSVMATIPESERANIAYLLGDAGLNAIAANSYQGGVIDLCANNLFKPEKATGSGAGQEVSLEQIALWNPELIVFQKGSIYDTVGDNPAWDGIAAIDSGNYYEVPGSPYCWLNNPPTVNQVMGMQWLPRLLYPDKFDTSIEDVAKSYYHTFYGYDLSDEEVAELTENALPKAA
ncbi:ABC transporter substrate-binding protein [Adlercreutzia sp. ZJ473]|uniref:ABC transporter substrate-binding protein n=1 Tax=Adlercreutzia sp. ZJ473 TaxID=2722822 RepID=UPI001558110D